MICRGSFFIVAAIVFVSMGLSSPDFGRGDIIRGAAEAIDGDTVGIDGTRIFLFGIDAPEVE